MPDEIIRATKTAHGYLASPLSEHISEMPDGSLVIVGCPIARTGFQDYAVRDLPQDMAAKLGIDVSNPSANIDLYRPASEVFAPEFLASLNGRPITDGHPPWFVTPENFSEYSCGHVQNVRKGPQPMDDGEWPVIADLVISKKSLIDKVRNKTARDISLGYDYGIARDGKKIIQCDMMGNHAAVVPKGRAGDLIAIGDAAPPADIEAATTKPSTAVLTEKKEKRPVKNNILHLLGLGLRAKAADSETDPEELAQAALDVGKFQEPPEAEDKKARDRKARDLEEEEAEDKRARDRKKARDLEEEEVEDRKKARDRKLRDAEMEENDHDRETAKDRKRARDVETEEDEAAEDRKRARDRKADDVKRKAMHDALDDLLDNEEVEPADDSKHARDRKAEDAGIEELKDLLGQFLSEEEKEPEHASDDALEEEEPDVNTEALDEVLENPAEEEEEEEAEEAEDDPGEELEEESEAVADRRGRDKARAADAVSGAAAALATLRPFVARCHDSATQQAFNTALARVSRSSRVSTGGYGSFARSARARDEKLPRNPNHARAADAATDRVAKLQAAYDNAIKEGK
jgi:hypothetical protein